MSRYKLMFSIDEDNDEIILHLGNGVSLSFPSMSAYDEFMEKMQHMRSEIKDTLDG